MEDPQACSEPCHISKMEQFSTVKGFNPFAAFEKCSILEVLQCPEYTFEIRRTIQQDMENDMSFR